MHLVFGLHASSVLMFSSWVLKEAMSCPGISLSAFLKFDFDLKITFFLSCQCSLPQLSLLEDIHLKQHSVIFKKNGTRANALLRHSPCGIWFYVSDVSLAKWCQTCVFQSLTGCFPVTAFMRLSSCSAVPCVEVGEGECAELHAVAPFTIPILKLHETAFFWDESTEKIHKILLCRQWSFF